MAFSIFIFIQTLCCTFDSGVIKSIMCDSRYYLQIFKLATYPDELSIGNAFQNRMAFGRGATN